jgi:hypothetical protein
LSVVRAPPRSRTAFLLLYGALLVWQIDRWCFTPHGLASTWTARGDDRQVTAASPRGVSQAFTMGADGLDGVWLRPRPSVATPQGDLIVDLLDVQADAPTRVERVIVPAAEAVRSTSLHVPFRQVRASRGRHYRLDVRHVNVGDGPGVELATSRDDTLPGGRFFADGTEQWGDLVFETSSRRATLPYWLHEVLRPWPAWLRSWPVIAFVMVTVNLVLAWTVSVATAPGYLPGSQGAAMPSPQWSAGTLRRLSTGALWTVVVAGLVIAARPTGRYRSLDLLDALPEARIEHGWGPLHESISPGPVLFEPRVRRAVVAMPPASLTWTVDVPREAVLRLGAGMRPDVWEKEGDGIQMAVVVEHAGGRAVAADLTLFPYSVSEHRRLVPLEVPLHAWAGQQVRIRLESTPERFGNAVNDVPVWTEPRIEWPRRPSAGTARVVHVGS